MSSFWTKLYRHTKCVLHMRLYSTSTTVTSGCGTILRLKNMSIKNQDCFSVDSWVGIIKDTVVGHCLLPDRLTDQCYYFLETVLLGCLKVCVSVRQQFYFNHTAGKMSSSGKITYPERCNGCGGPTAWPPQLHNSIQGIFSCGDTWRSTLHPMIIKDLV
jgi:hypothetical protein